MGKRYTIKPLIWEKHDPRLTSERAQCVRGSLDGYHVYQNSNGWWMRWFFSNASDSEHFDTIDAAKAAAQSHWQSRMADALTEDASLESTLRKCVEALKKVSENFCLHVPGEYDESVGPNERAAFDAIKQALSEAEKYLGENHAQ